MKKLWLIKNKKERIFGPYDKEEILAHIESGRFKGEELYSSYPDGNWRPLSTNLQFYEKFLETIKKSKDDFSQEFSSIVYEDVTPEKNEEEEVNNTHTHILIKKKERKPIKVEQASKKQIKVKIESFRDKEEEDEESNEVIEMEDVQTHFFDKLIKSLLLPVISFAVLAAVLVFFIFQRDFDSTDYKKVSLLGISQKRKALPPEEYKQKLRQILKNYFKAQVSNYLKAQTQLIYLLEAHPKDANLYQYLCLVQLELWPFSYQDTNDRKVLTHTLKRVHGLDRSPETETCKATKAIIDGRYDKALVSLDRALSFFDRADPSFLYYLKAKIFATSKKHSQSRQYIQSLYKIFPNWLAPYMLDAKMYREDKNPSQAIKYYQKVLSIFPEHVSANLNLGILEMRALKNPKKSEKRLKLALNNLKEVVSPEVLLGAYEVLIDIYYNQDDQQTLMYAKKAYSLNPSNDRLATLIARLGNKQELDNTPLESRQIIFQGDILANKGQCTKAQEYYKKAYHANSRKNALAAIRMAKCFWTLKLSGQAIYWLKKAIAADSKLTEAYFLLVEYLSDTYDFQGAQNILSAAYAQSPSSYEIFKANALLAFKQKQYQEAISYAERSVKVYSSDAEVYVLMSKAYRALGKYNEAYLKSKMAVEEDPNNSSSQIVYALALGSAYGASRGEAQFKTLTTNFPLSSDYRQALGEYYFENAQHKKALEIFQYLVRDYPDSKVAHIYLARVYEVLSNKEEDVQKRRKAIQYFLKASLLDVSDPEPLFFVGLIYMKNNHYSQAENYFNKVLNLNSNYPLIHYYIGRANFLQGGEDNLDRALKAAKTESQKNPNLSLAYVLAGDIYEKRALGAVEEEYRSRSYYELCASEYQKALRLNDKNIKFYIRLISCYKGAGEFNLAIQMFEKLRQQKGVSGYPVIYKEIAHIYEIKGDYEIAKQIYQLYFDLDPTTSDRKRIEKRLRSYQINPK